MNTKVVGLCSLFVLFAQLTFASSHLQASHDLNPHPAAASEQLLLTIEQSILDNIKQNGFDPQTPGGGLYVNWRYGTNPLQTNFAGSGTPGGLGTNHDPLTDLRYVHNLWLYQSQHPTDTRYESEIQRYTPIIKAEWAHAKNERGWLFDEEFMDLYSLSHDPFYQDAARSLVSNYAKAIDAQTGIIYKTSTTHPQGYYQPADMIEVACALIQAGTLFNHRTWVQQGQKALAFVYTHTYIAKYHTFGQQMDQVLTTAGTINPKEIFYVAPFRNYTIHGNSMRVGWLSQVIISLLHTYAVTQNPDLLSKAENLLNPLSLPGNTLRLWDSSNLGYFAAVTFSGHTPQQPGSITVATGKKEAGRQVDLLWVYHLANQYTNHKYQDMEDLMMQVALTKAYYASGHGVLYEVHGDWKPLRFPNKTLADVVTTEAMGTELEGLFACGSSNRVSS